MIEALSYYSTICYKDFSNYASEKLQNIGMNLGSLYFMIYVAKHPGCSHSELTNALKVDWGHSQRSVAKLVEDGVMTKTKSGRCYQLQLTEKGQKIFEATHQLFYEWDKQKLENLSDVEKEQLFHLLSKVKRGKDTE